MSDWPNYSERAADCAAFMRREYPDAICEHSGPPFKRPAFTYDETLYSSGFYWENTDADRFYFSTYEAAAADICHDMAVTVAELDSVKQKA